MINCSQLDVAFRDVEYLITDSDGGFVIASSVIVVPSLLLLGYGEHIVRPMSAVVGGTAGSVAMYFVLTRIINTYIQCEVRLVISGISGLLLALFALFVLKTGLFLIGAAAVGGLTHLVYESLPLSELKPPFVIAGRSGWYFIAITGGVLIGAILSQCQKKNFVRIISSLLGGGGIAAATFLVALRIDATYNLSSVVLLAIVATSTLLGTLIQHTLSKRKKERKIKMAAEKNMHSTA